MRRIIVLLMVAAVVAVMVLLAAGGPAMAIDVPAPGCEGVDTAHEFVPEGNGGPGSAGTHTETAHDKIPHCG